MTSSGRRFSHPWNAELKTPTAHGRTSYSLFSATSSSKIMRRPTTKSTECQHVDRVGRRPVGSEAKGRDEPYAIADKLPPVQMYHPQTICPVRLPPPPDPRRGRRASVDAARGPSLPPRPEKTRSRHLIPTQDPRACSKDLPHGLRPPAATDQRLRRLHLQCFSTRAAGGKEGNSLPC